VLIFLVLYVLYPLGINRGLALGTFSEGGAICFTLRTGGAASPAKTFEAVYGDIALWFRERVVEDGILFQSSTSGTQWLEKWSFQH